MKINGAIVFPRNQWNPIGERINLSKSEQRNKKGAEITLKDLFPVAEGEKEEGKKKHQKSFRKQRLQKPGTRQRAPTGFFPFFKASSHFDRQMFPLVSVRPSVHPLECFHSAAYDTSG